MAMSATLWGRVDEALPGVAVQLGRLYQFARQQVGVHAVDQHEKAGAQLHQQLTRAQHLPLQFRPFGRDFQALHGERPRHLEAAAVQLAAQGRQIGGQITVWPQFDPLITGFGGLVQKTMPRGLPGIIREPDTP